MLPNARKMKNICHLSNTCKKTSSGHVKYYLCSEYKKVGVAV